MVHKYKEARRCSFMFHTDMLSKQICVPLSCSVLTVLMATKQPAWERTSKADLLHINDCVHVCLMKECLSAANVGVLLE